MPDPPKIGQYRHTPAYDFLPDAAGVRRPTRVRRRFPLRGIVVVAYGVLGPLVCAVVSQLMGAGGVRYLPSAGTPLPPAPSMENLIFRAGVPEVVLASALAGSLLWRFLWRVRIPPEAQARGAGEAFRRLVGQALLMGPIFALMVLPVALYGYCVRAAPADVPLAARLLFAVPGSLALTVNYVGTLVVPLVVMALGLLMGLGTARAVAVMWQQYPEEPARS